jgi:hypothetical protein
MADTIELTGGDTHFDEGLYHLKHVRGKFTGNAHFFDLFGSFDTNSHMGSNE